MVNDVKQDKYGFLWVATGDGLNQYDGYNFKIYKNDPGNRKSLPNNLVYAILIDGDSTLWVGTAGGFSKFNQALETFQTFYPDSNNLNSQANVIFTIRSSCLTR